MSEWCLHVPKDSKRKEGRGASHSPTQECGRQDHGCAYCVLTLPTWSREATASYDSGGSKPVSLDPSFVICSGWISSLPSSIMLKDHLREFNTMS
jgi:hypothetical protein